MKSSLATAAEAYARSLKRLGATSVALTPEGLKALESLKPADKTASASRVVEATAPAASRKAAAPQPARPSPVATPAAVAASVPFNPTGDKAADMGKLREMILKCEKCTHLVAARKNVVFGVGNIDADIMFVGEAPGSDEDLQGEPFVGRAGQLLTKMIEAMGVKRADVFIANVLKCRPDMPAGAPGNRKPTAREMETCLPYLKLQIRLIKPKVMVGLGATAYEGLFGVQKVSISSMRGNWKEFEGIPFMPTFHPSYLLRNPSLQQKRLVWEDLLMVMGKAALPISEKQRGFFLEKK